MIDIKALYKKTRASYRSKMDAYWNSTEIPAVGNIKRLVSSPFKIIYKTFTGKAEQELEKLLENEEVDDKKRRIIKDTISTRRNERSFLRTTTKIGAGYGTIMVLGHMMSAINGDSSYQQIADILAPVASGTYALVKSSDIEDHTLKTVTQTTICSLIGLDIGHELGQGAFGILEGTMGYAIVKYISILGQKDPVKAKQ